MKANYQYGESVQFDRQLRRRLPYRWLAIAAIGATFVGVWFWVPPTTGFWVLLALTLVLTWLATYGWKVGLRAIRTVVDSLDRLEG